jgi:hypothetical protein
MTPLETVFVVKLPPPPLACYHGLASLAHRQAIAVVCLLHNAPPPAADRLVRI